MSRFFKFSLSEHGEVVSRTGRATVEERYSTLRKQIPIIYLLALVNVLGLQIQTTGGVEFGLNVPTAFSFCAAIRVWQWFHVSGDISPEAKLKMLRQTDFAAVIICTGICVWFIHMLNVNDPTQRMAVLLFGGFTATGVAFGLSYSLFTSRVPLLLIALPLIVVGLWSTDLKFFGATMSMAIGSSLVWRMLSVQNRQFADLMVSRSAILEEQRAAEEARHDAVSEATTDYLTGLRNRRAFITAIEGEIAANSVGFAVAILDLNRFKWTNDTFGHATGDKLLKIVGKRLILAAGREAVVARLGGDEFAVLFKTVRSAIEAKAAGLELLLEVNRPAKIDRRPFPISACLGVGVSRERPDRSPSRMLADADMALYKAKSTSSGRLAVFEPSMEIPLKRRAHIERAIQSPEFLADLRVVYQPIIDLQTGFIISAEVLARWTDENLGEVSPAEFVPIAEQLSLIGFISDHVLAEAVREASNWAESIRLSVNLSAVQLSEPGFAADLLNRLSNDSFPPARLEVEVTETALLSDFVSARENLATLSEAGIRIILDDFGSGFASVGYLREIHFDQIKLDGSLVSAAKDSQDGERLLRGVLGLCQALNVATVAEHIETEEQYNLLLQFGCDAGQGFWFQSPTSGKNVLFSSGATSLLPTDREVLCLNEAASRL
jgi:diguanylate cyclase (GGDEF)-like protein